MKGINAYWFIFLFLLGNLSHSQTIIPSGFVSGTWDSTGSPYLLQGSVYVHHDSALFIMPGVEVEMQAKYAGIQVSGYIKAVGTSDAPIYFSGDAWYGISIDIAKTYNGDSLRFDYCRITGGEDFSVQAFGGAMDIIRTDSVSINHCIFEGNWVKDWGGAMFLSYANILVRNSVFRGNHVGAGNYGDGGAIAILHSSPIFHNVSFSGNAADVAGAVYAMNSSPTFSYCTFTDNSCDMGNAGALYCTDSGQVNIRYCYFDSNSSSEKGGAVYMEDMGARIESSIFSNNQTEDGTGSSKGGAVYLKNGNYTLLGLEFIKNQALVGGALYTDNASITMDFCDYKDNTSFAGGGAIVSHKSGMITFNQCLFENNRAGGSGGAVALLEGIWGRFTNCSFIGNISSSDEYLSDGGGVLVTPYDNFAFFINCDFSDNSAEDYGGAAYLTSITQLSSCLFTNNEAGTDSTGDAGGGALALSEAAFPIFNCTFSGNTGGPGTTIYCEDAEFTLINSIIYDDHSDPDPKIFMSTFEEAPKAFIDHCDIEDGNGIIRGTGAYVVEWASGNLRLDPLFKVPGMDFRLSDESPCIDTARSDTLVLLIPSKDLDGNPRIFRGEIDMGCFENQTHFGISEPLAGRNMVLYPNPASEYINIRSFLPGTLTATLTITDMSGKALLQDKLVIGENQISRVNVSSLPPGMYIMQLAGEKEMYSAKVLISR